MTNVQQAEQAKERKLKTRLEALRKEMKLRDGCDEAQADLDAINEQLEQAAELKQRELRSLESAYMSSESMAVSQSMNRLPSHASFISQKFKTEQEQHFSVERLVATKGRESGVERVCACNHAPKAHSRAVE